MDIVKNCLFEAKSLIENKDIDRLGHCLEKAAKILKPLVMTDTVAAVMSELFERIAQSDDAEFSCKAIKEVLNFFINSGNLHELTAVLDMLSSSGGHKKPEQCIHIYNVIINELTAHGENTELLAELYSLLAECYFEINQYEKAEKYYKKAAGKSEEADNPSITADLYYRLGILHTRRGKKNEAERYFIKSLDIYKSYNPRKLSEYQYDDFATAFNGLATLYGEWGENEKSLEYMQKAKSIYSHLSEENNVYEADLAMIQNNMGLLYCNMQEYSDAFEELVSALDIYSRLEKTNRDEYLSESVLAYVNMGVLHLATEDYPAAVSYLEAALNRYTELEKSHTGRYTADIATVKSNLGIAYTYADEYSKAEKLLLNSLAARRKLAKSYPDMHTAEVADVHANLAMLYTMWDKNRKAVASYNEAIAITEKLVEKEPDRYLGSLSELYRSMGILFSCDNTKNKESIEAYRNALNTYARFTSGNPQTHLPDTADLYFLIGEVYSGMEDNETAETMYSSAYNIYNSMDDSSSYDFEKSLCLIYLAGAQEALDKDTLAEQSIMNAYDILKNGRIPPEKREQWMELLTTLEDEID